MEQNRRVDIVVLSDQPEQVRALIPDALKAIATQTPTPTPTARLNREGCQGRGDGGDLLHLPAVPVVLARGEDDADLIALHVGEHRALDLLGQEHGGGLHIRGQPGVERPLEPGGVPGEAAPVHAHDGVLPAGRAVRYWASRRLNATAACSPAK
jgi:hypothetical protein